MHAAIFFPDLSSSCGTLRRIESDNGPPFNSKEFNEFAKQEGFQHHRVTALHPRANGEAERFMQNLNKTEEIANLQGKNRLERRNTVQDMLIQINAASSYRSCTFTKPLGDTRENEIGIH